MAKTTVDLTEIAQSVKHRLMPIFGLKNILSAGLLLFDRRTSDEQKDLITEANGIESPNLKSNKPEAKTKKHTRRKRRTAMGP